MGLVGSVKPTEHPVARLESAIGADRHVRLVKAADEFRKRLASLPARLRSASREHSQPLPKGQLAWERGAGTGTV